MGGIAQEAPFLATTEKKQRHFMTRAYGLRVIRVGFVEGGKPENPEKNPRSTGENQQTQLTYDTWSGN